ncbi:FAD-dependent oxidoreductase [Falsiroseomonas ponticola]|uniref:FAD-dependent oxidoreductase n=1 Tax=Falsiroseomonas ponticola TaxID=2786951 RepID=UPI001933C6A8|nr:FAD-dependent oxidoreductase [Roseomonas ponticola]
MQRHLLLVGGGHAHVEVLRHFAAKPLPGWRLTLLTREAHSPYSGMLPGVIAGLYREEQALIDIQALAARAGAEAVIDRATGIDLAARRVHRAGGEARPFDLLSIDTGATPDTAGVPGAARHALPLKPIDALLPRLRALLEAAPARLGVVGAGAAGVEVALALRARLPSASVTLVAGVAGVLPGFPDKARARATEALAARRIAIQQGEDVAEVVAEGLVFPRAAPLALDAVLWATGAAAPAWLAETGLERDRAGFLRVDACLRAIGQDRIFACGDCAGFDPQPLPKAGVVAVRQGPVLARNLRAAAEGHAPRPYRPQSDWLVLLSLGDRRAIGTRNGVVVSGRAAWWLKDRIDRRFMARYQGA